MKRFFLVLFSLIVLAWIAIHIPFVQNWIVKRLAASFSEKLHTRVTIKHVDFSLFDKMQLEGLLIEDQKKDTLLYAGTASVRITDWFFFKEKPVLKYIGLQNTMVNMNRTDSVWNYQFLVDYFSVSKKDTSAKKSNFDIDLKILELQNIHIKKVDKWLGEDLTVALKKLDLKADTIDFSRKLVYFSSLNIDEPHFTQSAYTGNKPKLNNLKEFVQKIPALSALQWNTGGWKIHINNIHLNEADLKIDKDIGDPLYADRFDGKHIRFTGITGDFRNISFINDTLNTEITLTAKEQSGLELKKLNAKVKFTPDVMEFNELALETNRSRIGNYFAMRYVDFNEDFASFIHNIVMNANFENTELNSDDLAFFAPAAKKWKRVFSISGNANGTVDNLSVKKMIIKSGNTTVDGDIALRGLPDINNTFIDLKSNDLQTNYHDLISLVPSLANVRQPQLSSLSYIRFKGNFTGFLNDFVAFGNINTNLGNISADINMKLPQNKAATYSGKISSGGFQLGAFINKPALGMIAVDGKVKGSGFNLHDLNADFDGKIHHLVFSGYDYQNIAINGKFEKQLFHGQVSIDDPNLKIENGEGTISLAKEQVQFHFDALLQKANLRQLKLINEEFSVTGHFNLDFTGNNIDNFLGAARVYDATLHHDSTKLSFDSLTLNSQIVNGTKILSFESNELEGNLTGNFRLLELPAAFNVFLSRYYPSYISKPSLMISDQDFSFFIKTRLVDDYVQLLDKKLKGFNFSTFSGNLKLAKNELNVNANIPEFEYDKKIFNDVVLESSGNFDSLLAKITAGDIIINDSLHFPGSTLSVASHNDVSVIQLKTSAGKTLNEADLNATIQTLTDGVKIHFSPSSLIINDKKWQLLKDGELTIRENYIDASEVKFVQDNQEIVLSTEPDEVTGKTNLIARLKKVNINDFTPLFIRKPRLEGILTGRLRLRDPFGKQLIDFTGDIDEFRFEDKSVGKLDLTGDVDITTGVIRFKTNSNNKQNKFNIEGYYNYKDSTGNQMDIDFMSEHFNISLLEPYLGNVFSDLQGDAISTLKLKGGQHKYITGSVTVADGSFKIAYTQCRYKFAKHTILFNPDEIDLGTIPLKDTLGNTGTASGKLYHTLFQDFIFDNIRFETNKMLVLNTTKKDNSQFYGKVIGSALMKMNGPITELRINIDGQPSPSESDSSHIYLPTGSSREAGQIDYIEFIQFGTKMEDGLRTKEGTNIIVDMNLRANPACKIDVILDEALGDVIKGRGNGLLNIHVGSKEPLTIRGRYDITGGEYTFNFQTFLKKYFTIKRGSIRWNGDPYLAIIDIDAEYLAKNVDISSLASSRGFKQKENLTIISHLTGSLQKPDIHFDFEFPPNSEPGQDYITQKKLVDYKNDPNEMNKQVASLLLFNTFISNNQNFLSGANTISLATNTIGGIVSNLLTNLFNKQLEKATNGVLSTYFDINSSLDLQNKAALLQASVKAGLKILLSNRLIVLIGGNLDYNNPYAQLAKKGLITPDITIEWLLNKDGSLRVVGFNRTSIDLTAGQRNRSGISLSYRKDFDKLSEIFKKQKRQQEIPVKEETKVKKM